MKAIKRMNNLIIANCDTRLCKDSSLQTQSNDWLVCGIDRGEVLFIIQFETEYEDVVKAIDRDGLMGYIGKITINQL